MFPDKALVSWSCCCCLRVNVFRSLRFTQCLEPHRAAREIEIDAEVAQEVTAENSRLRESRRFVNGFHVEHRGVDSFERRKTKTQFRQLQKLHVFRYSGSAKHPHARRLQQLQQLFLLRELFGNHGDARCRVDDEVYGLLETFETDFTT